MEVATLLQMDQTALLEMLISGDPLRFSALKAVAALHLPDCWIAAGFVRDAVWDHQHGYDVADPTGDVDVIWYDPASPQAVVDRRIEEQLRSAMPKLCWSVKNQARMHLRNGDSPYTSVADAMRHWPETATAAAVRLRLMDSIEVSAPYGLDDLFALRLRPTPRFLTDKLPIFMDRVSSKRWMCRYPMLSLELAAIGRS